MPLLPKIQTFVDNLNTLKKHLEDIGFQPNHANSREGLANITRTYMTDIDLSIMAIDDTIKAQDNFPIPIRIYHPNQKLGEYRVGIFIHGGGHMCGSVAVYDGIARKICKNTNLILIAIDYRLAPEFPYPTGLNDCKNAIANILDILNKHKIKYIANQPLVLIGDSGGGAFCASISMDKNFIQQHNIKQQVLIYPSLDYTLSQPSTDKFAQGMFLEKNKVFWYFDNYFQNNEDRQILSPLFSQFHDLMPETLVIVADHDLLSDEGIAYHNKLLANHIKSELIIIEGVVHAYLMLENLCFNECEKTYKQIGKFINN